jgi:hypothetical protein
MNKNTDMNTLFNTLGSNNMEYNLQGFDQLQISPQQRQIMQQVSESLDFIKENRENLFCNEECQKNQKTDELYQAYLKAQTNLVNAPKILKDSEERYIKFTKGGSAYNQMIFDNLKKEAELNTNQLKKQFQNKINNLITTLVQYTDQYEYYSDQEDMKSLYASQKQKEENEVNSIMKENSIADRHVYYDTQWLQFWRNINYLVWIILVCIVCIYIVMGIVYKKYTDMRFIIYALILVIISVLPFAKLVRKIQDLILWN